MRKQPLILLISCRVKGKGSRPVRKNRRPAPYLFLQRKEGLCYNIAIARASAWAAQRERTIR